MLIIQKTSSWYKQLMTHIWHGAKLHARLVMPWFHMQFIACNALQFLCSNCILSNVMYNIYETKILQTYHIFCHVGKLATIAQKLQRVACNKSHMKPRHIVSGAVDDVAISGAHDLQLNYGLIRWLLGQCLINLSPSRGDNDKLIRRIERSSERSSLWYR